MALRKAQVEARTGLCTWVEEDDTWVEENRFRRSEEQYGSPMDAVPSRPHGPLIKKAGRGRALPVK